MSASEPPKKIPNRTPAILLDGETPALSNIRLSAPNETDSHQSPGSRFVLSTHWNSRAEVFGWLSAQGCTKLAIPSIDDLTQDVPATSILFIEQPVVGESQLTRLADLAACHHLQLVCDHFSQAADYALVARKLQKCFEIFLEINLASGHTGCRPGTDVRELVKGITRLEGVRIAGVTGNLGCWQHFPDRDENWLNSRIQLLKHSAKELPESNGQITIHTRSAPHLIAAYECVDEVRSPKLASQINTPIVQRLAALVISRPSLEVAVLNIGFAHGEDLHKRLKVHAKINGRNLPDATITSVEQFSTVIKLGPESRDLLIGNIVILHYLGEMDDLSPHLHVHPLSTK